MSPARYHARDVARITGLPTGKLVQHLDRGVLKLSANDIPTDGSGRPRKFCDVTLRKAALMRALTAGGMPPKAAGKVVELFHNVAVEPEDLLVVTASGEGRITREVRFGSIGQIVVGIGQLFGELQKKMGAGAANS